DGPALPLARRFGVPGAIADLVKALVGHVLRVERCAACGREDVSGVLPLRSGRHALLELTGPMSAQRADADLGDRKLLLRSARLGGHSDEALAGAAHFPIGSSDKLQRVAHVDRMRLEIDVLPTQRQWLAGAEAQRQDHAIERDETIALGRGQKSLRL